MSQEDRTETEVKDLRSVARQIRREIKSRHPGEESGSYPIIARMGILLLVVASLSASVWLLVDEPARFEVASRLAAGWIGPQDEVFELPPPPAREVRPRVHVEASGRVTSGAADGPSGVLYTATDPRLETAARESAGPEEFVAPERSPASEQAFRLLLEKSPLIRRLVEGEISEYQFKDWKPRLAQDPLFLIDLVTVKTSDQSEVILIWEVHIGSGRVRPQGQLARDFSAQFDG